MSKHFMIKRHTEHYTECGNKNQPRETNVYQQWQNKIKPNLHILYASVRVKYPAIFIEIFYIVQSIQQFKL